MPNANMNACANEQALGSAAFLWFAIVDVPAVERIPFEKERCRWQEIACGGLGVKVATTCAFLRRSATLVVPSGLEEETEKPSIRFQPPVRVRHAHRFLFHQSTGGVTGHVDIDGCCGRWIHLRDRERPSWPNPGTGVDHSDIRHIHRLLGIGAGLLGLGRRPDFRQSRLGGVVDGAGQLSGKG